MVYNVMSAFENIAIKDIVSGNDLIITAAGAAKVDGSGVVQPVSGTVTIVPSGTQDVNIVSSIALSVTGPLTDAQLRASPVPVSATNLDIRDLVFATDKVDVSGSSVSISSSALPTGAATAANQATIIGHVDGIEPLLTTIDADTSIIAGAVSGNEMHVFDSQGLAEQQELAIIAESIQELISRLDFLPSVRGIASDLRVTLLSGVVTTVSTVSYVS